MANDSGTGGGFDPWRFERWAWAQRAGSATRKLVLVGLARHCQASSGYGWVLEEWLADVAECRPATVRTHLAALEQAGFIARRREYRGGKRAMDGFLLLAGPDVGWPGDGPLLSAPAGHAAGNGHALPEGTVARPTAAGREVRRVEVPNWAELADWQRRVVGELRRFADAKGASLDEMKALAACGDFADRDHVGAAEKFAAWFVEGKGAKRARSNANATWREWLKNEDPAPAARGAAKVEETGDFSRFDFDEDGGSDG